MQNRTIILPIFLSVLISLVGCKNFAVVEKNKFYRSAQLSPDELHQVIEKFNIQTVINLRGANPDKEWWLQEREVTLQQGIDYINIRMSAQRLPHRKDLLALLDAYDNAQYPILIHCKAGADRAGEAAALYQIIKMQKSKKKAADQSLNIKFGHIQTATPAKRYFILDVWKDVSWAYNEYDPCNADYKYYDKSKYCNL